MDSLNYSYVMGTNRLDHVSDNVPAGNYTEDIDNQTAGNYDYDAIGNRVKDNAEGITSISWTVYGKIRQIVKGDSVVILYTYDPSGNRISKAIIKSGSTDTARTWYVRDAQGNVMSLYEAGKASVNEGHLTQSELHLYGSSRIGLLRRSFDVAVEYNPADTSMPLLGIGLSHNFGRGNKLFELSNHLGNVLVTVNDKKLGVSSNNSTVDYFNPQVVSAQDYYPFGMLQVGRVFNSSGYRFGFNGKENDNEVKGEGGQQDYGMRVYDPRISRFLSVDPLTNKFPYYSPYQFSGNSPIKFIDLDGLEPVPDQESYEGKTWGIDKPYKMTGGDEKFFDGKLGKDLGEYATTVDLNKFFGNNTKDKLKRYVNTNTQFNINENEFKNENDLVNYLLGTFMYGLGPENIVFPENGKFATILKGSVAVGESLAKWQKNKYKDGQYGWGMGLRGEINVDLNSGLTSLEHYMGSVAIRIGKIDDKQVSIEIFNVTSFVSGYLMKDIPVANWFVNTPESTVRNPNIRLDTPGIQPTYSNISQYFKITMSFSEAEKLANRSNPKYDPNQPAKK